MPPAVEVVVPQPPTEDASKPNEAKDSTPSKPTIGIIYPPPELRNIVDKTASFVARNGPEFEARIRQNEINNPKFNFLNPGDPYNAYYHHKVKEFKEGKAVLDQAVLVPAKPIPTGPKLPELSRLTEQQFVLKDPPAAYEFVADPPSISAFDLDIVKLTAQFVARNGRQFLTNLMNREQRNYQFDFLRPQHSLFTYFTKLLEQYTKILIPPKDLMNKLKNESETPKAVLEQVRYRVEWTRMQEAQKRREEEEAERERVQYAQIDWHDFVVVETVDYQPNEQGLFPPPTNPDEVGTRVLQQQRMEEEGEEVEMEVESDDEGSDAEMSKQSGENQGRDAGDDDANRAPSPPPQPPKEAPPQPPPLPPQPDKVVVRKDYNPKVSKVQQQPVGEQQYLISPITGEKIPADKMQEHMRIGLLDPRWVEQRDRALQEKLQQEEVYAQGSAIESSLKQFAERRTDIFGDEETAIGKKIGEEEKKRPEKVTWDGHTASMEAATRAARANITIEEQIQQIHKIKGLLPDEEKERIGPSKPQNPPLPPNPPPPPSATSTSSIAPSTSPTTITTVAPPASKPQPPPLPPASVVTTTTIPISTQQQRPPPPPPPMTMTHHAPSHIPGLMHQPLLPPPQGLMMAPLGPPSHLQPPPLLAMSQRPPMAPGMGPAPPFGQPMNPMPPPPPQPPMEQPNPPPPVTVPGKTPSSGPAEDEPPAKRQRTEESLVPEEEFLKNNKSPVTFRVQVPSLAEKAEWKLNGQMVALTLPLTDTVSVIKAKIHEETGMPPGKQKLQYEGLFFKDSNTLAYYNVMAGAVISLQLKERGGRKK